MMRTTTFLLLFAIFLTQNILAQPTLLPELKKILTTRKSNLTLPEFLDILKLNGQDYIEQNTINQVEVLYIKKQEFIRKVAFRTNWFHFAFVTDHSHHILVSSITLLGEKAVEEKRFELIHDDFLHYVQKHERFYGVKIDLHNKDMSPFYNYEFGTGCGIENEMPLKCKKMFELIRKNKEQALYEWVQSMNPAIQAYGILGLYLLEKKEGNLKLKKKAKQIINYVKNKTTILDACSNLYADKTISMNEVLSDSYMETIWYMFKDSEHLK